jgi:hypothetical protein
LDYPALTEQQIWNELVDLDALVARFADPACWRKASRRSWKPRWHDLALSRPTVKIVM